MNPNDGGPAHPSHGTMGEVAQQGMSLRDHFAGLAMNGIISTISGNGVVIRRDNVPDESLAVPKHKDLIASYAYAMADAMLIARARENGA